METDQEGTDIVFSGSPIEQTCFGIFSGANIRFQLHGAFGNVAGVGETGEGGPGAAGGGGRGVVLAKTTSVNELGIE